MKEISQTLADARGYIEQNLGKADSRYRPRFHAVPPVGWMNDPNGFFYDGEWYHLFYQHYPYEARWNDMHWGHWRTRDLVTWENLPVAMAPDMPWDACGCFSGTALPDGRGGAHILYTGVSDHMELQQQCYASFHGETMEKAVSNPVIPFTLLPEGYVRRDFRDPKLFRTSDGYRAVMAAKHTEGGRLVCFSSADLEHWTCSGIFCPTEGLMPECPDVFLLGGKTAVLYSQVAGDRPVPENRHPVLYALGSMDAVLDGPLSDSIFCVRLERNDVPAAGAASGGRPDPSVTGPRTEIAAEGKSQLHHGAEQQQDLVSRRGSKAC